MNIPVYDIKGKKLEELTIPEKLSGIKVSVPLLHEVVTAYLANQREGTACTKTKAEVSGGGAKPWRQKGTGRARVGSIRSPLWRKGGVVFGPKPRSYRQDLPKKKIRQALLMAIYSRIADNEIIITKDFAVPDFKTKKVKQILDKLKVNGKTLLVVKGINKNLKLAVRNLGYVNLRPVDSLHTYDVLNANKIIFTQEAFNIISAPELQKYE